MDAVIAAAPRPAPQKDSRSGIIAAGSLVALVVLASIAALSYQSIVSFRDRAKWVDHSYEVLHTTELIFSELKDAETAVRGFVITRDEAYLDPYRKARESIPRHVERLLSLTGDNPEQTSRGKTLTDLAQERLNSAESTLRIYRKGAESSVRPEVKRQLDSGKSVMDEVRRVIAEFREEEERLLRIRADETNRSAQQTIAVIVAGNVVSLTGLALAFLLLRRDVTDRARAQIAAQRLAAEIEDLYDRAPCGYHSVNKDGIFVHVNDTEIRWLGYSREELVGKMRFIDIVAPEHQNIVRKNFPKLVAGGTTDHLEYDLVRKDGSRFPVSVSATAIMDENGQFVMSRTTMFDIGDLVEARTRILEANAFLDTVVENIPSMIFVKHADTLRFARVNRAEEEMLGMPREDVIGKSDHDLFPASQADFFTSKDREVLAQRDVVDIQEEVIDTPQGQRILHTRKIGIRDGYGTPQYLLGISHDITDRIQAEKRIQALAADLEIRANQLEAANKELESFSYSVSHDLRSPLRAIDGFSRLMEEDYGNVLDAEGNRLLTVIRQNSQRMGQLIDDLLAFSRLGRKPIAPDRFSMNELVAEALEDVHAGTSTPPKVTVQDLPDIAGDRVLLRQVWINLISNAFKYSSKNDDAAVEIGSLPVENGSRVYFVRDNGVGFDMQYYDKLFGVFQRLHRIDEFPGTGVGLAIVQRVVSRHGGRAWADARLNEGATFYFSVPEGEMQ